MTSAEVSREQYALARLHAAGLSWGAAAGVVGNLDAESSVNPDGPAGDGGTSHGIAQWHLGRWDAFLAWAKRLGRNPKGLDTQVDYAVHEAQGMGSFWTRLSKLNDPGSAAALWQREYERPANLDPTDRARRARSVFARGAAGVDGGTPYPGPATSSDAGTGGFAGDPGMGGGSATAQTVGLDPTSWIPTLIDGSKRIAFMGLAGVLGLGLVGYGVATAAKGKR